MATWYKARRIEPIGVIAVEVDKETERGLWLASGMVLKSTSLESYFESEREAYEFLLGQLESDYQAHSVAAHAIRLKQAELEEQLKSI